MEKYFVGRGSDLLPQYFSRRTGETREKLCPYNQFSG
jgi:hypothetical protein